MQGTKRGSAKKKVVKSKRSKAMKPTLVVYVLDETGSMSSVRDATISGFNEYCLTLKQKAKATKMTLIKFNSNKGAVREFSKAPISQVERMAYHSYSPAGATPLYDAIMEGIADADVASKAHDIVFVIQTDGEENASHRHGRDEVFREIEKRKKDGWAFVFMGADQDAWKAAQLIGIPQGATLSYTNNARGTAAAMSTAATATANYVNYNTNLKSIASAGLMSFTFTDGASVTCSVDLREKKGRTVNST